MLPFPQSINTGSSPLRRPLIQKNKAPSLVTNLSSIYWLANWLSRRFLALHWLRPLDGLSVLHGEASGGLHFGEDGEYLGGWWEKKKLKWARDTRPYKGGWRLRVEAVGVLSIETQEKGQEGEAWGEVF